VTAAWDWTPETLSRLQRFLSDCGLCDGPLRTKAIGDGHSNLTYLVTDGTCEVVVRRPPPPPVPPGGHDVLREAKLISAIYGTGVPVPEVLAIGQAGEVLDVPFYVMSYVPGIVATVETPERLRTDAGRRGIAEALIDTLAALHAVDWRARGLEGFGRPEGFNGRHLRRMARLVEHHFEPFAPCFEWLEANVPPESGASILHGDFRLGNLMLGTDTPERIVAVLDWELATLGDPLLDVGYFLASYPEPGEARTPTQDLGTASCDPGWPGRGELARRYGGDLSQLRWYTVMAMWKLAVLYEYSRRRGEDAYYADPELVQRFLAAAHRHAGLDALTYTTAQETR
jgi:aminoglycoside phosphotransferase (APT) family kinase protein